MNQNATLPVSNIVEDHELQSREAINVTMIEEYKLLLTNDINFNFLPIEVYKIDNVYKVTDGFHRLRAYRAAGRTDIPVEVKEGTFLEALRSSLGANSEHGMRRSHGDKLKSIKTALSRPEWESKSDVWIAKTCKSTHQYVNQIRKKLKEEVVYGITAATIAGVQMNTTNGTSQPSSNKKKEAKMRKKPKPPSGQETNSTPTGPEIVKVKEPCDFDIDRCIEAIEIIERINSPQDEPEDEDQLDQLQQMKEEMTNEALSKAEKALRSVIEAHRK